jgi:hypothetical protein
MQLIIDTVHGHTKGVWCFENVKKHFPDLDVVGNVATAATSYTDAGADGAKRVGIGPEFCCTTRVWWLE